MPAPDRTMSEEMRERLVRIEEKTSNQAGSLDRIEGVLEDLVAYVARNEDNRREIADNAERLDELERSLHEQKQWMESRLWFVTSILAFIIAAAELALNLL
jgi:uncharacterized coiled-coil protein SlyX